MTRRISGGGNSQTTRDIATLIQQLESGSNSAETQLLALLADADADAFVDSGVDVDVDDELERCDSSSKLATQTAVLNGLALSAATGSPYSLEVLLAAIVEYDLAGPAIGRVTQNPEQTKDIGQDVLVNVARSIHRYRAESKFTTWLYVVARNIAVNHARKLRSTLDLAPDDMFHDNARRRMSSLVAERDVVKEAIATLPPEFRTTVVLRDLEGLSYAEIAERQGLQINTVRSRLSRGRALLAERLR